MTAGDYPQWRALFDGYLAFYEATLREVSIALVWERLLAEPSGIEGLVAVEGEQLFGFVHFHYQTSTWHDGGICYLEDLYVAPEARRRGVGELLIEGVRSRAAAHGCGELQWITRDSNLTAQRLYDRVAVKTNFLRYEIQLGETN